MSKTIYLSGPMTGMPDMNFPAFNDAAKLWREEGYRVINPAEVVPDTTLSWEQCMRHDIKALMECDMLVLLPGWESSKGAHLEVHIAHRVGMTILQYRDLFDYHRKNKLATA